MNLTLWALCQDYIKNNSWILKIESQNIIQHGVFYFHTNIIPLSAIYFKVCETIVNSGAFVSFFSVFRAFYKRSEQIIFSFKILLHIFHLLLKIKIYPSLGTGSKQFLKQKRPILLDLKVPGVLK